MRVLIDIGHPGHVHLFRPFALNMQKKGHDVLFTCRQKEFEIELLEAAGFNYTSFGKHYKTKLGKIWGLLKFDIQMFFSALKFKPDVFLSHGSFYAAHTAFLFRKPHISFEDTFNFEQIRLYKPFTSVILSSNYEHPYLGKNNIRYKGYHELAYLHPKVFSPNNDIIKELNLGENTKYCIIRFVSWEATHDINHDGMSLVNKRKLVKELSKIVRVLISSEKELPNDLQQYKFPLVPEKMHDALAFSSLIFGESATMVAEGAVLGVPGVYIDNTGRLYTKELENEYDLVNNFSESEEDQIIAINKAIEILTNQDVNYKLKQENMLKDKINVTDFLVWFVENYPNSFNIMQEDPHFQNKFK